MSLPSESRVPSETADNNAPVKEIYPSIVLIPLRTISDGALCPLASPANRRHYSRITEWRWINTANICPALSRTTCAHHRTVRYFHVIKVNLRIFIVQSHITTRHIIRIRY